MFVDGDDECSALIAAHGAGAETVERSPLMAGPDWAAARAAAADGRRLSVADAANAADVSAAAVPAAGQRAAAAGPAAKAAWGWLDARRGGAPSLYVPH